MSLLNAKNHKISYKSIHEEIMNYPRKSHSEKIRNVINFLLCRFNVPTSENNIKVVSDYLLTTFFNNYFSRWKASGSRRREFLRANSVWLENDLYPFKKVEFDIAAVPKGKSE